MSIVQATHLQAPVEVNCVKDKMEDYQIQFQIKTHTFAHSTSTPCPQDFL